MEREHTAARLKTIMNERNLKQIDILKLTEPFCHEYDIKMNKSDLSQYVSGKVEPNQKKLFILGKALNVSEAWLMGYDVSRERKNEGTTKNALDLHVLEIVAAYEKADMKTKNYVRFILDLPIIKENMEEGEILKTS